MGVGPNLRMPTDSIDSLTDDTGYYIRFGPIDFLTPAGHPCGVT